MDITKALRVPTSFFKKQGKTVKQEAPDQLTLKSPVKMEDGSRVSGFTDAAQDTAFGYTKNGSAFTIKTKDLAVLQIVPKKGKKASETEKTLREVIDNKILGVQTPTKIPVKKMPTEPGLGTGLGPVDALINSLF